MSKPITVAIILMMIFLADLLSIQQTVRFRQDNNFANEGNLFVFLLIAQVAVAVALLSCGGFIFYKTFSGKKMNL